MKKSTIIIIGVIVIAVLWCFSAYNGMVTKQESATTAFADVQATYQRRADLLPNLTKTVKAYAAHEKETFDAVTKARAEATQIKLDAENMTPEKFAAFQKAQGNVASALGRLMAIAENYPELKANENFRELQVQLEGTENRINEARQKYNAAVQNYNQTVRTMPNALVAGLFGFEKMEKFEAAAGAEKAPELDL